MNIKRKQLIQLYITLIRRYRIEVWERPDMGLGTFWFCAQVDNPLFIRSLSKRSEKQLQLLVDGMWRKLFHLQVKQLLETRDESQTVTHLS